jgi:EAL domain-containing protein (putative c-di-GMP-specific phosphodiesterase class I)/ActR/RegA family two-component response regulator
MIATPRMLVVDDDKMICKLLRCLAEELGYEVYCAQDGASFRRVLRACDPDIVLLDLIIPGTDGVEMLKHLAASHCTVPIVLMSGLDDRAIHAAERLGKTHGLRMFGGLEKPFERQALVEVLAQCGFERKTLSEENLLEAIDRGELRLHYQPQVDASDRRVRGVEALVRWQHPEFGLLLPCYFLPAAEQTDVMCSITRWVCSEAIGQLARWRKDGLDLTMAINLSARDIKDEPFPNWIEQVVCEQGLNVSSIVLEVTEREATAEMEEAKEALTRLRLKGFQLSIDDFGTGYSSLAMLQQVPFGELKIDKFFVMESLLELEAKIIVQAVVNLGHSLGLRVISEGVEEENVLELMRESGVDVIQGYLTGRPMSAAAFSRWMANRETLKKTA